MRIKLLRIWNQKRFVLRGTDRDYSTDMVALCKITGVTTGNHDEATQAPFGGLFKGFEGYRTPSDEDYCSTLTNALVVLDTNVLLNLYRYNDETRSSMIDVMRALGDRFWVPNHVLEEFWRNRERALASPLAEVQQSIRDLEKQLNSAREMKLAGPRVRSVHCYGDW